MLRNMIHNYSENRFLFIIPQTTKLVKYVEDVKKKHCRKK